MPISSVTRLYTALMEAVDCYCVQDDKGNKVCMPDNCDAGRAPPEVRQWAQSCTLILRNIYGPSS